MPLSKTQRITGIIVLNLLYIIILIYLNFDVKTTHDNTWAVMRRLQRTKIRLQDGGEGTPDQPDGTAEDANAARDKGATEEDFSVGDLPAGRGEFIEK